VRVRVRATGLNRADTLQRRGFYPAPSDSPADIPGLEYAGEIDAIGPDVEGVALGERVFGLVGGGAHAEQLVVHARMVAKIPDALSYEEAAAIPEAFITAYDAMVTQAALRGGEPLLVHAVGSGVGTAAVQLGHALGAEVIGTARNADKIERAKQLGLDHGILVGKDAKFADDVRRVAKDGVAVVLELVGGAYVEEDLRCLQILGRIAVVGLTAGARTQLDLGALLHRRARIFGTTLRARPLEQKIAAMRCFEREIVPLVRRGKLKSVIDRVYPLAEAASAHTRMESNESFGKIILTC
jgi:putative PIG3 family NAD(P)H quinone oxidoreductase